MINFRNKHFVIFGGSRGIGAACALAAGKAGASVSINYLQNEKAAKSVCNRIVEAGSSATTIAGDISKADDIMRVLREAVTTFGPLDGAIISSGILQVKPFKEVTEDDWDHVQDVNLKGSFLVAQAFAKQHPESNPPASLVFITSTSGNSGSADSCAYSTSKGGQMTLMKCVARALAGQNIRANCIAPAWTETDMAKPSLDTIGREQLVKRIPLGRIGLPEDVVGPACFLLSDLAAFVTGVTLHVDGGSEMRG